MSPRIANSLKWFLMPWRMEGMHAVIGCLCMASWVSTLTGILLPGSLGVGLKGLGLLLLLPIAVLALIQQIRLTRETRRNRRLTEQLDLVNLGLMSVQDLPPDVQEDINAEAARVLLKLRKDND